MLMRALMLNPRRPPKTLVPTGHYWSGLANTGHIVKATWSDALGRLTFEQQTNSSLVRPGVSGTGYVGIQSQTFPRRLQVHQVTSGGLVNPAATSYPLTSLPSDWTIVAMLANGEVLLLKSGAYKVQNAITGAIGPTITGALGFLSYGDGFALFSAYDNGTSAGAPYFIIPPSDLSQPGQGVARFRIVYDVITGDGATPLTGISSTGAWSIPISGIPYAGSGLPGTTPRVRTSSIVVGVGFARSGAMLASGRVSISEAYVGNPRIDGRVPVSTTDSTVQGILRVAADGAIFLPTSISRKTANVFSTAYSPSIFAWNLNTNWDTSKYSPVGDQPTAYQVTGAFGTVITEVQTDAPTGALIRLRRQDGGVITFDKANDSGSNTIVSLPHLGALLAYNRQSAPGVGRISFDGGATWRIISIWKSTIVGQPAGADYPPDMGTAVPLFPYSG